jgi:hypothetical protein
MRRTTVIDRRRLFAMSKLPLPAGKRRRLALLGTILTTTMLVALVVVPSAQAVLPDNPSDFESGNDPTLGLGNMVVDTNGNND